MSVEAEEAKVWLLASMTSVWTEVRRGAGNLSSGSSKVMASSPESSSSVSPFSVCDPSPSFKQLIKLSSLSLYKFLIDMCKTKYTLTIWIDSNHYGFVFRVTIDL